MADVATKVAGVTKRSRGADGLCHGGRMAVADVATSATPVATDVARIAIVGGSHSGSGRAAGVATLRTIVSAVVNVPHAFVSSVPMVGDRVALIVVGAAVAVAILAMDVAGAITVATTVAVVATVLDVCPAFVMRHCHDRGPIACCCGR